MADNGDRLMEQGEVEKSLYAKLNELMNEYGAAKRYGKAVLELSFVKGKLDVVEVTRRETLKQTI